MNSDKKPHEAQKPQDGAPKINLDDYAGDEDDNRIATERADRYMDDIERAKEQGTLKPDQDQPE